MRCSSSFDALTELFALITETILPPLYYMLTDIRWKFIIQFVYLSSRHHTFTKHCHSCAAAQQRPGVLAASLIKQSSFAHFTVSLCVRPEQSAPGCHQGFLAAVLAFPLGPVLIWVISTSVRASGGRHERMRSMVFW